MDGGTSQELNDGTGLEPMGWPRASRQDVLEVWDSTPITLKPSGGEFHFPGCGHGELKKGAIYSPQPGRGRRGKVLDFGHWAKRVSLTRNSRKKQFR